MSEKTYGDLGRNYFLKYRTIFFGSETNRPAKRRKNYFF